MTKLFLNALKTVDDFKFRAVYKNINSVEENLFQKTLTL